LLNIELQFNIQQKQAAKYKHPATIPKKTISQPADIMRFMNNYRIGTLPAIEKSI